MRVVVRRALPDDAGALAELAARTFYDTFADSNSAEDMEAFLTATYGDAMQLAEITDPHMTTLLAEIDGVLGGFAQILEREPPSCVKGEAPIEIKRFYVAKEYHGTGVSQQLMRTAEDAARSAGAKTLWLGVWERNHRALAFYRKNGFTPVGRQPFLVGSDLQTDIVLERPLQ